MGNVTSIIWLNKPVTRAAEGELSIASRAAATPV